MLTKIIQIGFIVSMDLIQKPTIQMSTKLVLVLCQKLQPILLSRGPYIHQILLEQTSSLKNEKRNTMALEHLICVESGL
jgi:hypothetical protein